MSLASMERELVREELAEPLRRVLGWLMSLENQPGQLLCPAHQIEHTGKSAGALVIACALAKHDPEADQDKLLDVARRLGKRLVGRLQREGDSTCFTFRPGRHDPYNCSNNVIDGGACSDALAELVQTFDERLEPGEREEFAQASIKHAQTYLRYAVMDKGIPAQKAWAMTGVAQAYGLSGHDVLELTVREGVQLLAAAQNEDGSFPYHPLDQKPGHAGASDVSAFYQSRVTAFTLFALQKVGLDPTSGSYDEPIRRGLEFLMALQGPDGRKVQGVEAKPWYWAGPYEVASHPFDTYALAEGWRLFRKFPLARGARLSFESWVAHLTAEGEPRDHMADAGTSYQCPAFWAGHASWMARSLPMLEKIYQLPDPPPVVGVGLALSVQHFASVDLVRLEDDEVVAWVRGARPPFNVHHGSPTGAGLLQVARKSDGELLLRRGAFGVWNEAEWIGRWGLVAPRRGWDAAGGEVRFGWWLARAAFRGARPVAALCAIPKILYRGVWRATSTRVTTAFDRTPQVELLNDGVVLDGRMGLADGSSVPATGFLRSFRVDGDGLVVEEHAQAAAKVRRLNYRLPKQARDVVHGEGRVSYRLS